MINYALSRSFSIYKRFFFLIFLSETSALGNRSEINLIRTHTHRPRVVDGYNDDSGQYPYVVALMKPFDKSETIFIKACTGSLISSKFVITAAHCFSFNVQYIRCGDMKEAWDDTKCKSKILRKIPHPLHVMLKDAANDIAIIQIEELEMETYGKLHAADYKTLAGKKTKYAGFGKTVRPFGPLADTRFSKAEEEEFNKKPLQIGDGVIYNDRDVPFLVVAPRCSRKTQHIYYRDSGGPLFVDGRIVGICNSGVLERVPMMMRFCPISPYLGWIKQVIFGTTIQETK